MKRLGLIFLKVFFLIQCLGSSAHAQTLNPPGNLRLGGGGTVEVPPSTEGVPLSWGDPAFASVTNSAPIVLSSGSVRSNLSITQTGNQASVQCNGSCTLNNVRISSREGVRCTSGNLNLNWTWVETQGASGEHADGLQCYSPGLTGVNTIKNTTFRAYNHDATAGYFSADNWRGTHIFENVLFWGGPFGLRINVDGGSSASLKNVYFVKDSFGYSPFRIDVPIVKWENVRWVTIVNGQLVPGALIPKP